MKSKTRSGQAQSRPINIPELPAGVDAMLLGMADTAAMLGIQVPPDQAAHVQALRDAVKPKNKKK